MFVRRDQKLMLWLSQYNKIYQYNLLDLQIKIYWFKYITGFQFMF